MAPAERRVVAEGEGGGRTTPEECESVGRLDGCDVLSVEAPRGEPDSAVALPPSEGSSGICTFRRGLAAPPMRRLFDREGGVNVVSGIDAIVPSLFTAGGGEVVVLLRGTLPTSSV